MFKKIIVYSEPRILEEKKILDWGLLKSTLGPLDSSKLAFGKQKHWICEFQISGARKSFKARTVLFRL